MGSSPKGGDASGSVYESPAPKADARKIWRKVISVGLVPALDRNHPNDIVKDFENDAVTSDPKAVLMRAGKWFGKLERVRLGCKKAHLGANAPSVQGSEAIELIFRRRREDNFHTL
jgi:hypothetical protein